MKRMFKKLMALTLALAMVGSTMAMAAQTWNGDVSGTGGMEGYVGAEEDIFSAELPTNASFNFIMDPQGLIAKSVANDSGRYEDANFTGDTALFFPNADGNYSQFSDVMSIVNKGNVDITVDLTAKLTDYADLEVVAAANGFTEDNPGTADVNECVPGIYLAVETGKVAEDGTFTAGDWSGADGAFVAKDTAIPVATEGTDEYTAEVYTSDATTVAALTHSSTEPLYKWDADLGEYVAEWPEDDEITYSGLYFRLTGAVNQEADWKDATTVAPQLQLVWTIEADTTETFLSYVEKFTVTFDMNGRGEQADAQEIAKGAKASDPNVANADGYEVVGCYTDAMSLTSLLKRLPRILPSMQSGHGLL